MYKNNFICVIKHNGKVLREIDGEVHLPFNSQYSILLKNKDSRRSLVSIEVDGENVLAGKSLIINGNTSQEIKGFMRNMSITNRFKFIHKTKEISNHRGNRIDDGLVTISYTFEKEEIQPVTIIKKGGPWDWPDDPNPYPKPWPGYYPDIKYCSSLTGDCGTKTKTTVAQVYSDDGITIQGYSDDGITVKGSKINQPYQYGDIGELETRSYVITLQLKGKTKRRKKVTKPLTVKTKLRCTTCGRRSKSSSKFCSNCGTYLE